jgi:ERCC4-type nuclease
MEPRLRIIIDTREQSPWAFGERHAIAERGTIKTGDYALYGDSTFAIERKSLDDFLGTISSGWDRFMREVMRMEREQFVAKVVIVEGDFISVTYRQDETGSIIAPKHNHPQVSPAFVAGRIADLTLLNVSILFAHNSILAAGLATTIFRHRARGIDDESKGTSTAHYICEKK